MVLFDHHPIEQISYLWNLKVGCRNRHKWTYLFILSFVVEVVVIKSHLLTMEKNGGLAVRLLAFIREARVRDRKVITRLDQGWPEHLFYLLYFKIHLSDADHNKSLTSRSCMHLSNISEEHQGCNWGMQLIDGCSLELCVTTLSVASADIVPHK